MAQKHINFEIAGFLGKLIEYLRGGNKHKYLKNDFYKKLILKGIRAEMDQYSIKIEDLQIITAEEKAMLKEMFERIDF